MSTYRSTLILALAAISLVACNDRPQPPVSVVAPAISPQARGSVTAGTNDPSLPAALPVEPAKQGETNDHAKSLPDPHAKMTGQEETSAMPKPGQANDHSSLALDPKK